MKPLVPVASTLPLTRDEVARRVAAYTMDAPTALAGPPDIPPPTLAPAPPPRRSRKRLLAGIAAAVIVLALLGTCGLVVLSQTPTLTLSSATVAPGEDVVVTARRVPANVNGEVELYSTLRTFPFRADGGGNVSIDITIPRDIGFGDHLVKLCYSGTCHAQQTLHVTIAGSSPTPTASPPPPASPALTPRPGSPSPTATPTPAISVLKYYVKPGDAETVGGGHFPGSTVVVYFVQGKTDVQLGTAPVTGGEFTTTVRIPSSATSGPAAIRACYSGGCAYATINVM